MSTKIERMGADVVRIDHAITDKQPYTRDFDVYVGGQKQLFVLPDVQTRLCSHFHDGGDRRHQIEFSCIPERCGAV